MEGSRIPSIYAFHRVAGEINTRMPEHVVHTVADALNTYHELGEWARCNRGYVGTRWRTCPYRQEKFGRVIKATVDYTDSTDILEP